jgi:hypothetical protein
MHLHCSRRCHSPIARGFDGSPRTVHFRLAHDHSKDFFKNTTKKKRKKNQKIKNKKKVFLFTESEQ